MRSVARRASGALLTETLVTVFLVGLMIGTFAVAMTACGRWNSYLMARERCIAAGQAQLDALASGGEALSEEEVGRLWPFVRVSIEQEPGEGDWTGLTRVSVTAATVQGKSQHVRLSRYMASDLAR